MLRFRQVLVLGILFVLSLTLARAQQPAVPRTDAAAVEIDARVAATPFPHFWEQAFGSGRANLALRENYRRDLREVKAATDLQYVRFHAIFHDENGVYSEDEHGAPVYNWSYVDQIYDGLLDSGVRPFVELGFMPKALASQPNYHAFWYRPIISPPKDYIKWEKFIAAFAQHLIDRYGIDEVAQWYFEVWNEPNMGFWGGEPAEQTYFELYDHTARALKSVNPRIRVGGPATAQAAWVGDMIAHATDHRVPLDFVSTHVYGNDSTENVFHDSHSLPSRGMVGEAVKKVHEEIMHSANPRLPLLWSEFNASYANEPQITDSIYMGPWLADTIRRCDGLVDMMSYWTFSDVFEEGGPVKTPFYGGFGLIAAGGIKKPAYYAFSVLHKLGEQRLENAASNLLVTRRKDGTLVVAAWNLADADHGMKGAPITLQLVFKGISAHATASIARVDAAHGNPLPAYQAMNSPQYPTRAQVAELNLASTLPAPERVKLAKGVLQLTLPVNGLAVIELPVR